MKAVETPHSKTPEKPSITPSKRHLLGNRTSPYPSVVKLTIEK
jgi:hypothetical protein